ncbi:MAG: hypothetical protein GDA36_04595 [Rhodobacteraceae bacterium]|nr:hypothetical protein [Paracoccaceae bacterium]
MFNPVNLPILSGSLALQRAKHRAKRFWWSGYAIAGVCGVRVVLFAAPRQVQPDCRQRQLGVLFWPARTVGRRFIVA